jgi:peptide/nickel transport system permease protein
MFYLILRRLLWAIPTILIVIGIVFVLYQYIPGDPVESVYVMPQQRHTEADSIAYQNQYQIYAKELGLDKPLFFFSLSAKNTLQWNGFDNQYVIKVISYFKGDFGNSYRTKKPVLQELSEAIRWSLTINLLALLLIFVIGIALGLRAAMRYDSQWDKRLLQFSFFSDVVPSFWLATILMVFFTSDYYGIKLFPSIGLGNAPYDATFVKKFFYALPHLILPILIIVFSSISIVIRQMRSAALGVIQQDFVRTSKAKGLNDKQLMSKHIFPNAIFPIITLLGVSFPQLIAGSVLIENIFNIPGMGKLSIEAILNKDFPMLFAVILLTAILTIIGNLMADILYRKFNPKIV